MNPAITILAANTELVEPVAAGWQLILAALAGIALIVVLITVAKLHPFLALIFGAITVGIVAQGWNNLGDVLDSFGDGFGTTAAGVGVLIALGAMLAKLLVDSGEVPTRSSTRSSDTPRHARCRGQWRWSALSSACRCSSKSVWCC
jgi:gluconate:H+ symporter, GntP family